MPVPKSKTENLNQYGRDAAAPCERDRGATGFTKLNHKDFWPDVPRLTNGGKVQILLIVWIFRMRGAPGPRGVKTPAGWTPWIRWDELAERFGCSVRSVQDDTHDLDIPNAQNKRAGRGVIETEDGTGPRRGEVRFKLLTESWESLPNYEPGKPVAVPPPEKASSTEPVALVKKPVRVRQDKESRAVPVKFDVTKLRLRSKGFEGFDFLGSFSPLDGILTLDILNPGLKRAARVSATSALSGAKVEAKVITTAAESHFSPTKRIQSVTENPGLRTGGQPPKSFASVSPKITPAKSGADLDPAVRCAPRPSQISVTSLAAALRVHAEVGAIVDDAMARRVLRDCQAKAPECSEDEVIQAVDLIGSTLSDNVRSPLAVIRSQVPKMFETGKLLLPKKKESKDLKTAREIMRHPSGWTAKDLQWARETLNKYISS